MWTSDFCEKVVYNFDELSGFKQESLILNLNNEFSVEDYDKHLEHRRNAIVNLADSQSLLEGVTQEYPAVINAADITASAKDLDGFAIVFTAGGDGERLRISLEEQGVSPDDLKDFTKATYALPGFYKDFGALHINLSVISKVCSDNNIDIPVVITTGPEGSVTARVIPELLEKYNNFGLKDVVVVKQDARFHFTMDELIAYSVDGENVSPVTHPDETGGPIVKLKEAVDGSDKNALQIIRDAGCSKIMILQGTSVYNTDVVFKIAAAAKNHDGIGVGIARDSFPTEDPFGTYVALNKDGKSRVCILEKDVRNEKTRELVDSSGGSFLPYNTGFYAFDIEVLENNSLPDYATPPKQISAELEKSPKCGYAATDILPLASNPAVLTIAPDSFGVIKSSDDLAVLTELSKSLGLDKVCSEF